MWVNLNDVIYASSITTDTGTAEKSIEDVTLQLTSGLIWLFEIDFPPGCCGLLHVQIFDGLYQVLPASVGESMHGDAVTMRFDDLYFKTAAPHELKLRTWNEDNTWGHTVQIRVGMASGELEMSRYMPGMAWKNFEKLMVESIVKQEALRQLQLAEALKQITPG